MTTPHPHRELGIAFFEGKTLQQYRQHQGIWKDWVLQYCPDFSQVLSWRIKPDPDEPKKVKYLAFESNRGHISFVRVGSVGENDYNPREFKRVPELDREVTLPEGE